MSLLHRPRLTILACVLTLLLWAVGEASAAVPRRIFVEEFGASW